MSDTITLPRSTVLALVRGANDVLFEISHRYGRFQRGDEEEFPGFNDLQDALALLPEELK